MSKNKGREYIISDEVLEKAIKVTSTSTVGVVMKRFDVVENKEELKKVVKESIYEGFRHLGVFIKAVNLGIEFKSPSK